MPGQKLPQETSSKGQEGGARRAERNEPPRSGVPWALLTLGFKRNKTRPSAAPLDTTSDGRTETVGRTPSSNKAPRLQESLCTTDPFGTPPTRVFGKQGQSALVRGRIEQVPRSQPNSGQLLKNGAGVGPGGCRSTCTRGVSSPLRRFRTKGRAWCRSRHCPPPDPGSSASARPEIPDPTAPRYCAGSPRPEMLSGLHGLASRKQSSAGVARASPHLQCPSPFAL